MTIKDVIPLVAKVYDTHAAGCCLHLITDDGNLRDSDIAFCIQDAKDHNHPICLTAALAIAQLSRTQRNKLYKSYQEYAH